MISLRTFTTLTTVVAAALTFAACSDTTTTPLDSSGMRPGGANFNSSKNITGPVDARVLLSKSGDAILELHTGTFDDATNTGTPSGTLSSVTYTVKNGTKTITSHTVSFSKSVSSYFAHVNLCNSSNDDDDDDGSKGSSSCNVDWGSNYALTFTADLKGLGSDGKSSGTASGTASTLYLPDIDLTQQGLFIVGAGGNTPAVTVAPGAATSFTVAMPNNKAIANGVLGAAAVPNAVGVQATCLVTVDGFPQLPLPNGVYNKYTNPNAFGYTAGIVQTIAAGQTGACPFTLTLPAGQHKIVVTAIVLYPGDYDVSNNSTATFTVSTTVAPLNVSAGLLTADAGAGNVLLANAAIHAGASVTLYQGATLVAGAPPGNVPCTITITSAISGFQTAVLNGTVNLPTTGAAASCPVTYTFPTPGAYTVVGSVNAAGDLTTSDNTTAPVNITVLGFLPTANVTLGAVKFSDPAVGISMQQIGLNTVGDTTHSGDVVTFETPITAIVQNAPSVDVTCAATMQTGTGTPVNVTTLPNFHWVSGPVVAGVSGTSKCAFSASLNDTDASNPTKRTVAFSITATSIANSATTNLTASGSINNLVRNDVAVGTMKILVNGTPQDLTGATIKQGATVTIQVPFSNNGPLATGVRCGQLLVNNAMPSGFTIPAIDSTPSSLLPSAPSATAIALTPSGQAGSTGVCTYTMTAPGNQGLGAIPLISMVTTATGTPVRPLDPTPSNNVSTGTFTIVSNGAFTSFPPPGANQAIFADQIWLTPPASQAIASLTQQDINVNSLALLLIPTQDTLGTFALSGTVTSGATDGVAFGTGNTGTPSAPVKIVKATGPDQTCVPFPISSGQNQMFANPTEPELRYSAIICSEAAAQPGFQRIVISYSEALNNPINAPRTPLLFADHITLKLNLTFTLNGSTHSDAVTATIVIPAGGFGCAAQSGDSDSPSQCNTNFGNFVITTP